jgi:phospholipase C
MSAKRVLSTLSTQLRIALTILALSNFTLGIPLAQAISSPSHGNGDHHHGRGDRNTRTPIKHVIVIIGENRSFDHVFATYQPVSNDSVNNLLSEGIVKADGTPGPNYPVQNSACDTGSGGVCPNTGVTDTTGQTYQVSPKDKELTRYYRHRWSEGRKMSVQTTTIV